ncbi:MAG: type III pantothenate kinase [Rickettsiales bacterium]|nr:type III pantothenate kinase [Rickettsiales bacterium]
MFLVFDVGNTATNFAAFDENNSIAASGDMPTNFLSADALGKVVSFPAGSFSAVIMSSVVRAADKIIEEFAAAIGADFFNVKNEKFLSGFSAAVADKTAIGSDILCNVEYGKKLYGENFVVIDMGTATTFDIVGKNGLHRGEVFIIGANFFVGAMGERCDLINEDAKLRRCSQIIGTNTKDCIERGAYFGYLGAVKEIFENIRLELGMGRRKLRCLLTGGYSHIFADGLSFVEKVDNFATIKGAKIIWDSLQKNS